MSSDYWLRCLDFHFINLSFSSVRSFERLTRVRADLLTTSNLCRCLMYLIVRWQIFSYTWA